MKKIIFILAFFISNFAFALSPESRLQNSALEQRAMKLFLEVKCVVCNGQSVESSDTEFSRQMRQLIREKILEGKSDQKIRFELTEEFGDDILFSSNNEDYILWFATMVFVLLIGAIFIRNFFVAKK